jgi:hypothetical protein
VPKANINQPGVIDRPPRPWVGDVLLLVILQVAGIAVTRILLRVLFGIAWSGYPIAGAIVGAAIFGTLEKLHRPKTSNLAYVFYLALWSAPDSHITKFRRFAKPKHPSAFGGPQRQVIDQCLTQEC